MLPGSLQCAGWCPSREGPSPHDSVLGSETALKEARTKTAVQRAEFIYALNVLLDSIES